MSWGFPCLWSCPAAHFTQALTRTKTLVVSTVTQGASSSAASSPQMGPFCLIINYLLKETANFCTLCFSGKKYFYFDSYRKL